MEKTSSQWQEIFARATAASDDAAPMPSALLVYAHPDDETIALGARLARFQNAHLVQATDGAPQDEQDSRAHGFRSLREYRQARAEELGRALNLAGVGSMTRDCLGIPDQEAGLHLSFLTRQIFQFLLERRPEVIFTHPYEGGHPDHDACAFAVHHAVEQWRSNYDQAPLIVESPFYHAKADGVEVGTFLSSYDQQLEVEYELTARERLQKQSLLSCFATQRKVLEPFPLDVEQFRVAPAYCFAAPPHAGAVYYDSFSWPIKSRRFCELAQQAEDSLAEEVAGSCR